MRAMLLAAAAAILTGCATGAVIEKDVPGAAHPSSTVGFKHWLFSPDGKTHVGAEFDSEGHDTYNWLISQHGADLQPPRGKDFGVTVNGDAYDLTEEAVVDWGKMATWERSAEHPKEKSLIQKVSNAL